MLRRVCIRDWKARAMSAHSASDRRESERSGLIQGIREQTG